MQRKPFTANLVMVLSWHFGVSSTFFQVSSGRNGRKWKKPLSSSFFRMSGRNLFLPEETQPCVGGRMGQGNSWTKMFSKSTKVHKVKARYVRYSDKNPQQKCPRACTLLFRYFWKVDFGIWLLIGGLSRGNPPRSNLLRCVLHVLSSSHKSGGLLDVVSHHPEWKKFIRSTSHLLKHGTCMGKHPILPRRPRPILPPKTLDLAEGPRYPSNFALRFHTWFMCIGTLLV